LREELGELTEKQQQLITVLEVARVEEHLPYFGRFPGRPAEARIALARAFTAKAVYHMATTRALLDRLESDVKLRRICGWERAAEVPSESTFSRAFAEFAQSHLPERVHQALIERHYAGQLVGHLSRDSTAIEGREKPVRKQPAQAQAAKKPKQRGRPRRGEEQPKEPTRLERPFATPVLMYRSIRAAGMSLPQMLEDLPTACDVGTKKNSQGHKESWIGYKLHLDVADGAIPISCLLSAASLHDSQAAIPLAAMSHQRVTNLYDVMDSAPSLPQDRL
jgi:transposase